MTRLKQSNERVGHALGCRAIAVGAFALSIEVLMARPSLLNVSYRQIAVFSSDVENPFNEWSAEQFASGYAWRPDSVSFGVDGDGDHLISIYMGDDLPSPQYGADPVIDVTLKTTRSGMIEVASIADSILVPFHGEGIQLLRFELVKATGDGLPCVFLSMAPKKRCQNQRMGGV